MRTTPSQHETISTGLARTADIMATPGLDERLQGDLRRRFHGKGGAASLFGPVFEAQIDHWDAHPARMVAFWSSVARLTGRHHGAAMAEQALLPVRRAHFARWLVLFHRAAQATCPPVGAAHLLERADRIARSFCLAGRKAGSEAPAPRPTVAPDHRQRRWR